MNFNSLLILLIVLCISCESTDKPKIFDEFRKANSEAQASLDSLEMTNPPDTSEILTNPLLQRAAGFVFRLKNKLAKADPSDERTDIADSLIVYNRDGIELFDLMYSVYSHSETEAHKKAFAEMQVDKPQVWLNKYFHKIPTIVARTLLTKFSYDIELSLQQLTQSSNPGN